MVKLSPLRSPMQCTMPGRSMMISRPFIRNPPAKSFKGQKGNKKDGNKQPGPKIPPKKRRLVPDLSDCIVDLDQVSPAADDETLCSVPILNARAAAKLSTMPVLCITKKLGAYIKNESGHEAAWFPNDCSFSTLVIPHPVWVFKYVFPIASFFVVMEPVQFGWEHNPMGMLIHLPRWPWQREAYFVALERPSSWNVQWTCRHWIPIPRSCSVALETPLHPLTRRLLAPCRRSWLMPRKRNRAIAKSATTRPRLSQMEHGSSRRRGVGTAYCITFILHCFLFRHICIYISLWCE